MKSTANYWIHILMAILMAYPSIIRAEDTDAIKKDIRISWAVMPQFDLNLPGNWKTLKPAEEIKMTYGGGIGVSGRIQLKSDWLIESGVSICYDNLQITSSKLSQDTFQLSKWSIPISLSLGHSFKIDDEMGIVPLAGIEASYSLNNKVNESSDMNVYKWNRYNFSWGIGCGLCLGDRYEIDVMGYFGLVNIISHSKTDLTDNRIRMSFKYYFR